MWKGHVLVFFDYCLYFGGIRGKSGVKKGSKRAHLPINVSINVIKREIVRTEVGEVEGICFDIFQLFPVFLGDKGEIWGLIRVTKCPSPNKSQYECY